MNAAGFRTWCFKKKNYKNNNLTVCLEWNTNITSVEDVSRRLYI